MPFRILVILFFLITSLRTNAQIVINEICAANGDLLSDPDYINFSNWIELHNTGSNSVSVGGFFLSDDESQPTKWRIPANTTIAANGFLLIWCDEKNSASNLHANFSLDSDGETIILSNAQGAEVDLMQYPKQYTNISYGRIGDEVGYIVKPSPRAQGTQESGTQRLDNPTVSVKSGRYSSAQSVTLSHSLSEAEIRFTLDGSEPTETSMLFESGVSITSTSTLKAKAFLEGFLPSKTEVKTYFINERTFSLPVISISMNEDYLWDDFIGIYADGTNGVAGNCTDQPRNWNQDWSRHADIEFFNATGEKQFDQSVDIRIGGACSRNNPQKSLVVKARDKYGKNVIEQKLFASKPSSSYGGFILRNSGNDFSQTMFRDALMQYLVKDQMDIDYLASEPKMIYINGDYWGILNLNEKIDSDYFESNYNVDKDDLDLGEWAALEGSIDDYQTYLAALENMDRTTPEAFTLINQNIDVQEYINYLITEIYFCNTDWPGNNVKYWRDRSVNGKWRWVLWDLDFGLGLYQEMSYPTHPTLNFATATDGPGWPNPPWSTQHIRLVLENPEFRSRFISTFSSAMATTFHPDRVIKFINEFQARISAEMPFHIERWGQDYNTWVNEVERLRTFARQRHAFMYQHIAQFFGLDDLVTITGSITPPEAGSISLNNVKVGSGEMNGGEFFRGVPYTFTPVASPGFKFVQWNLQTQVSENIELINPGAEWKYLDNGTIETGWYEASFDDSHWSSGTAEFGYGEGDESTLVSYGSDNQNKHITTYFRKTFQVEDTVGLGAIKAKVNFDDGVVVYFNGTEVFRNNLPEGAVEYGTFAINASPENVFTPFSIAKGIIRPGDNTIAVEVHQVNPQSSDVSFDFGMSTVILGAEQNVVHNGDSITGVANANIFVEAIFEAVDAQPAGVIINEFSASNTTIEDSHGDTDDWIELYNAGDEPIDINGFFVTDNSSARTKFQIAGNGEETIIEPGAYMVLWADEETDEGPLHVNFKLSADGEYIGLFQSVGGQLFLVDEVSFDEHGSWASYSRIPNGSGEFQLTMKLTPMAVNELEEPLGAEDDFNDQINFYPNPGTGEYKLLSPAAIRHCTITSVAGQEVGAVDEIKSGGSVSLKNAPAGVYVFQGRVGQRMVTKRLVKIN